MSATGGKPAPAKRAPALLLAGCAALLVVWLQVRRQGPERLLNLADAPTNHRIWDGTIYRPAYRDSWNMRQPVVVARRLGQSEHVLFDEDSDRQFSASQLFHVDGQGIVYAASRYPKNGQGAAGFGVITPPNKPWGPAAAPSRSPVAVAPVLIRELPLAGGAATTLLTLRSEMFCLVDRTLFWLQPEERAQASAPSRSPGDRSPLTVDLMAASLADRVPHMLRRGLLNNTTLTEGATGIFWTAPDTGKGSSRSLWYAGAARCDVHRVATVDAEDTVRWSVECGGALTWCQSPATSRGAAGDAGTILSFDPASGATSVVCDLADLQRTVVPFSRAAVYRVAIYILLSRQNRSREEAADGACLCRLTPGRKAPLEDIRTFGATASQFQFDHGYLYYISKEKDVGLWQSFTDDSPGPLSNVLYRVPLP